MGIPKYNVLYVPVLTALRDGQVHTLKDMRASVANMLQLSEDELTERLPCGRQTVFENRIGWARTYLKKAGLISSPRETHYQITEEGKALLESGVAITNALLAERYPSFAAFVGGKKVSEPAAPEDAETPQETLERVHRALNAQLADDLLVEIMNQSSVFFERLVVDLMKAMGYGDGFVTKTSGDGGIDGIIHEDKLGFNLIYLQAKRWNPENMVGKPEIQKFAGAMMGPPRVEKGLFITTARFTSGAQAFADAQHIILVDGRRLAGLMIEYGLGVSTQSVYRVQRIDSDYFAED